MTTQTVLSEELTTAIRDRVRAGRDGGGFVEHVANRDWERALATADALHREQFTAIMVWRLNALPAQPVPLAGSSAEFMATADTAARDRVLKRVSNEAAALGYVLVELEERQYDLHQEHNAGAHEGRPLPECADCAEDRMEGHAN